MLGSISNKFWNQYYEGNNRLDISSGIVYRLNKYLYPSFSTIYSHRKYDDGLFSAFNESENNMVGLYFVLGCVLKISKLDFNFTLADSHLLSGKWREQTILKVGASYQL